VKQNRISIAYVSPGWPLQDYPNGIVAYIQNIVSGFDADVVTQIIAHKGGGDDSTKSIVGLSQFDQDKNLANKGLDKLLSKCRGRLIEDIIWQRKWSESSRRIVKAVNLLNTVPDLIEVEESFGIAKWLVKETDIPVVTRLHCPWFIHRLTGRSIDENYYQRRVSAEGLAIKCSQGITSPSLDVLNRVRDIYDCELSNAMVIPNPIQAVPEQFRWRHCCESKRSILFVGRFDPVKGGDLALDAFRIIAQQDSDVELVFIGPDRGIEIDGKKFSFNQYVETFIPEKILRKRIKYLGSCNSVEISRARSTALVTVVTSRYENFPMTLLEALATGSPVVGFAVGGINEIIVDGYNGLLAEAESPDSVAEKVLEIINDIETLNKLSKNAIEDSKRRFSPEIVAKLSLEFYKSVLAGLD